MLVFWPKKEHLSSEAGQTEENSQKLGSNFGACDHKPRTLCCKLGWAGPSAVESSAFSAGGPPGRSSVGRSWTLHFLEYWVVDSCRDRRLQNPCQMRKFCRSCARHSACIHPVAQVLFKGIELNVLREACG